MKLSWASNISRKVYYLNKDRNFSEQQRGILKLNRVVTDIFFDDEPNFELKLYLFKNSSICPCKKTIGVKNTLFRGKK